MKHIKQFTNFLNEDLDVSHSIDLVEEGKKEQIKYLKDFIIRWDNAQDDDKDLKSLETEFHKKLTQFGLPKMSADELLYQLQNEGNTVDEASVQIAGKHKPSGAKILATLIVDDLIGKDYLKPGADKVRKYLIDDIATLIMDSTF